eukprot:TRINITY_DN3863_c1_g1_i1.p1 TRINITY_DN3863_c1_g1~~TRINITY_DN3863_c1_g1_i1.p1  ORF type:complete len:609 (+),score=194.09 TRINITY_DN3863_c1_g1_i1:48-1874(+)
MQPNSNSQNVKKDQENQHLPDAATEKMRNTKEEGEKRSTRVVALLGPPGSGKGTQAAIICKKFPDTVHVSAGDMMKIAKKEDQTSLGDFLRANWSVNNLTAFAFELIEERIAEAKKNDNQLIVLDGCIKVSRDIERITSVLHMHGLALDGVIYMECPEVDLADRLAHRLIHLPSGRTYHPRTNPPKVEGLDDETAEPLTRRDDDDQLKKRLTSHTSTIKPILDRLGELNLLHRTDATLPIEEVAKNLEDIISKITPRPNHDGIALEDMHACDESTLLHQSGRLMKLSKSAAIMDEIAQLDQTNGPQDRSIFPGPIVYPIDHHHLEDMKTIKYLASPKINGIRYLASIGQDGIAFINRRLQVFQVLPISNDAIPQIQKCHAILDGELIMGKDNHLHYIIFDALKIQDENVTSRHLRDRLSQTLPRLPTWNENFPIKFSNQHYKEISECDWISKNLKSLPYVTDGIVFTPSDVPYATKPQHVLLKWKPLHLITVDCYLVAREDRGRVDWTLRGRSNEFFENFTPGQKERDEDLFKLKNKIVEFFWDQNWETTCYERGGKSYKKGGWRISRIRQDKTSANPRYILDKIRDSVTRPIFWDRLVGEINLISKK